MSRLSLRCRNAVPPLLLLCMLAACQRADADKDTAPGAGEPPAVAGAPAQADPAAVPPPAAADAATGETASLPADFREYGSTPFDGGRLCVVGAASNAEQLAQRPYIAVKRADGGQVLWARALSGIEGMYQARATHCVHEAGALRVLLQSDTHSQQTLSQTQLSVATIAADGGEPASEFVAVPGTQDRAYSAWVEPGAENFAVRDGRLHVRGRYRFTEDPEAEHEFDVGLGLEQGK